MRFLADMGVSIRVVDWLLNHGHDAVHLRDQGLCTLSDDHIFAKAITENRIVITFDLDFGEIAARHLGQRTGVIVFRIRNTRVTHVIERLENVLTESCKALEAGAVIVIEESRHRIRYFVFEE